MDKQKRPRSLIRRQSKNRDLFPVQVSYAGPDTSIILTVNVKPGTTIRDAFELSGIRKIAKNIRLVEGRAGIFGEIRPLDTPVKENDRIEIYRPLVASPKETRKKRIEQGKTKTASKSQARPGDT
ncbi:RnfH family protein [Oxalobacter vibrioformis]|uniref:UPF0125 protein NB640_08530 n=1 Tax=Oxalobacter vibrioformis TaxID=933080 RepID=A0A9E9LTE5_9BURK|nr:RnfH family protein [Oxalobacter vibrioformis]WAW09305.1 RnfH family protein [Oxalobacter vibrioformis]